MSIAQSHCLSGCHFIPGKIENQRLKDCGQFFGDVQTLISGPKCQYLAPVVYHSILVTNGITKTAKDLGKFLIHQCTSLMLHHYSCKLGLELPKNHPEMPLFVSIKKNPY